MTKQFENKYTFNKSYFCKLWKYIWNVPSSHLILYTCIAASLTNRLASTGGSDTISITVSVLSGKVWKWREKFFEVMVPGLYSSISSAKQYFLINSKRNDMNKFTDCLCLINMSTYNMHIYWKYINKKTWRTCFRSGLSQLVFIFNKY